MNNSARILAGSFVLALTIFSSACVVAEPREGYWDREHARYYHEHHWHECGDRAEFCR